MKRKEVKKALREMPIETVLMVGKSELTPKQREFARNVAMGYSGAEAYRQAYDTKAKPHTVGTEASQLKANPAIAREIEAYELALEAQKYRSSESLRALVIQSLVQVLIDPDSKHSQRVAAAKVLGTVTEVAAFTERKEITTISGSDTIKAKIMDQLRTLMLGNGNPDITDVEAVDLLSELQGVGAEEAGSVDPTAPVPPAVGEEESPSHVHTIPHKQSPQNPNQDFSIQHKQSPEISDTPLSSQNEDPPGGI